MDSSDVFPNNANKKQLDGGKEKQTDDLRRHPYLKIIPENQFIPS